MELRQILQNQGLSPNEARIYLAILRLGEGNVSKIATQAQIKRPTAYILLDRLLEQGFVGKVKRGKTLFYRAINPYAFLDDRYQKYCELKDSLPQLLQLHEMHTATPEMTVYEGTNGIQRIMEDTLTSSTEILAWANMELASKVLQQYYPDYIRRRVAKRISIKAIFSYGPVALSLKKRDKQELRESYLISGADFPLENEINIYDHKVAIISHSDLVGVIIQNKAIANTQRAIYKLSYAYAKLQGKN